MQQDFGDICLNFWGYFIVGISKRHYIHEIIVGISKEIFKEFIRHAKTLRVFD